MPRTATAKITKVSPVVASGGLDATDFQVGNDQPRVMKSTGKSADALDPADNSQQNDRLFKPPAEIPMTRMPTYMEQLNHKRANDPEYLANLAFMREKVEVFIHHTSNPVDAQRFEIGNNGTFELFTRGQKKTVERRFANELATRKITRFTQVSRTNSEGVKEEIQMPSSSLAYPFNITRDDNPLGAQWLAFTLAQN